MDGKRLEGAEMIVRLEPQIYFTWRVFDGVDEVDTGVWKGSEASLRAMLAERWGDGYDVEIVPEDGV